MRLPFKGLYKLSQLFGVNPDNYKQFLVLYPDGNRYPMKGHNGLDFACPTRTEIVAPHSGEILEASFDQNGYGNYVKIENDEEGSVIAHLDEINVQVGFSLAEGDHIGWSDNTGNSTAPHCHWGYYRKPRDRSNGLAGFIDQTSFLHESGIDVELNKLPTFKTPEQQMQAQANTPGNSTPDVEGNPNEYKGLDLTNEASVKVAIDTWWSVANGEYVKKELYDALESKMETTSTENGECTDVKTKYNAFAALGYNTVDDVTKALAKKDADNLALQIELARTKQLNSTLASSVSTVEGEDSASAELGIKAQEELIQLKKDFIEIVKALGVSKPGIESIITAIYNNRDKAEKFLEKITEKVEAKMKPKVTKSPKTSDTKKDESNSGINWLASLFGLKKEVK